MPITGTSMRWAFVLIAVAVSCTGEAPGRQAFVSAYCDLLRPCCAQANLAIDGQHCRAVLDVYTPRADFDPTAASVCLDRLRASARMSGFCQGEGAADRHACDRVFRVSSSGTVAPGQPCVSPLDCAPSPDGAVVCQTEYTTTALTRTCQVQVRGQAGDGPCLYTVPDLPSAFPYPDFFLFSSIPGIRFRRGADSGAPPPPPPARAYLCHLADGLACSDQTQTCTPRGSAGQPCAQSLFCQTDAYCSPAARTCQPRRARGAACDPPAFGDSPCVEGAHCDPDTRTCVSQLPEGAACLRNEQCAGGALCVNQRCTDDDPFIDSATTVCGRP